MTSFTAGRAAEAAAAAFLQHKGCHVLVQNWRTRECEIDIIAERLGVVYFCEVKYRRNNKQGSGLAYITPKKVAQMHFAARQWMAQNSRYAGYRLSAIEVSGTTYQVTAAIADVS
jgi:uncharacterized protein (TIGR00252 family)